MMFRISCVGSCEADQAAYLVGLVDGKAAVKEFHGNRNSPTGVRFPENRAYVAGHYAGWFHQCPECGNGAGHGYDCLCRWDTGLSVEDREVILGEIEASGVESPEEVADHCCERQTLALARLELRRAVEWDEGCPECGTRHVKLEDVQCGWEPAANGGVGGGHYCRMCRKCADEARDSDGGGLFTVVVNENMHDYGARVVEGHPQAGELSGWERVWGEAYSRWSARKMRDEADGEMRKRFGE